MMCFKHMLCKGGLTHSISIVALVLPPVFQNENFSERDCQDTLHIYILSEPPPHFKHLYLGVLMTKTYMYPLL